MYIDLNAAEPVDFQFDEGLAAGALALDDGEEIALLDVRVRGRGVRERPREVALQGAVEARLRMRCVRCLEAFDDSLSTTFELILVPEGSRPVAASEHEVDEREALLFVGREGRVELVDVAREQIYLNLPLKPLCRPDCRGLCPTCGANRNRLECGCRSEEGDGRLAPLLEFKKRLRGS